LEMPLCSTVFCCAGVGGSVDPGRHVATPSLLLSTLPLLLGELMERCDGSEDPLLIRFRWVPLYCTIIVPYCTTIPWTVPCLGSCKHKKTVHLHKHSHGFVMNSVV
jgi:hypothetical protein